MSYYLVCRECDANADVIQAGDVHYCPECQTIEGEVEELQCCINCYNLTASEFCSDACEFENDKNMADDTIYQSRKDGEI